MGRAAVLVASPVVSLTCTFRLRCACPTFGGSHSCTARNSMQQTESVSAGPPERDPAVFKVLMRLQTLCPKLRTSWHQIFHAANSVNVFFATV